jgi:hypothetical protein
MLICIASVATATATRIAVSASVASIASIASIASMVGVAWVQLDLHSIYSEFKHIGDCLFKIVKLGQGFVRLNCW